MLRPLAAEQGLNTPAGLRPVRRRGLGIAEVTQIVELPHRGVEPGHRLQPCRRLPPGPLLWLVLNNPFYKDPTVRTISPEGVLARARGDEGRGHTAAPAADQRCGRMSRKIIVENAVIVHTVPSFHRVRGVGNRTGSDRTSWPLLRLGLAREPS